MTTTHRALLCCLLGSALSACTNPPAQPEPTATAVTAPAAEPAALEPATATPAEPEAAAPPAKGNKTMAPVDVDLRTDATADRTRLTLTVTARADIPRAVARFVVPADVTVLDGKTEHELGALGDGQSRTLEITVAVPAQGSHRIAAGLDVHLTRGVKLYKGATVQLGTPAPATEGMRMPLPEGGALRVDDAK